MGAIGGIVDFCERKVDFSAFNRMRLSMALRGRKGSTAFLYDGIGLFFNRSYDGKIFDDKDYEQPYISDVYGKVTALCIDSESIMPSAAWEKYFTYGTDFLGCLDGGFALALYDEERGMLILARDRKGKKPLYYRIYENRVYFSSEPKGLLGAIDEPFAINKKALCGHILSPVGLYKAPDIYSQIKGVLPGEYVVFTRLSISRHFYNESRATKHIGSKREITSRASKICCSEEFDTSRLNEYLTDALISYDYPEFDFYMPFL